MSKTSIKNKELKSKAKEKKPTENAATSSNIPNYGKCCTCKSFINHPGKCRKHNKYCARKADACNEYNLK